MRKEFMMKVKLKEDLLYSKLTDLVCMDKGIANKDDYEFLYDVIKAFTVYGKIVHSDGNLELYMTANDVIELQEKYSRPDYICDYHGLILDFSTDGELEVII